MGPRTTTTRSAPVIGSIAALTLVAAAILYLAVTGGLSPSEAGSGDVAVVLVLPDEGGVAIPRTITRYAAAVGLALHVDPRTPARIPGTTYDELRDAYPFGGGAGLAEALRQSTPPTPGGSTDSPPPSWVVVDHDAWLDLAAIAASAETTFTLSVDLPEHMEVFDGERLYTFAEGETEVRAHQLPALFNGVEYLLEDADRDLVRRQVADELTRILASDPELTFTLVQTGMSESEYIQWARIVSQ